MESFTHMLIHVKRFLDNHMEWVYDGGMMDRRD